MQMLFYPFKEQLNLPSFPIKFSDSQSIKSEVIGKESVDISCAKVLIDNKSKCIWILFDCQWFSQLNAFIRDKSSIVINLPCFSDFVNHIVLCAGYKECVIKMKMLVQSIKLNIPFVHQVIGIRFNRNLVHHHRVMHQAMCQMDECGNRTFGSSDISSDSFLKRKTAEQIVYLNCDQQMYSYEQQFSISCLGSLYPQMHS